MYSFRALVTCSIDVVCERAETNNAPKRNTPSSGRCAARVLFFAFCNIVLDASLQFRYNLVP